MEDAELATEVTCIVNQQDHKMDVFGIFDGHAGAAASAYVKNNLAQYLKNSFEKNNQETLSDDGIWQALKECFINLDTDYTGIDGTTATVAIILNDKVWIANTGDSRTILIKNDGTTVQASEDAKPDIPRYKKTIEKLGGFVLFSRVNAHLGVARAIGDKGIGRTNFRNYRWQMLGFS